MRLIILQTAFRAKVLRNHPHQGELIAVDIMLHGLAVSAVGSNLLPEAEPWPGGPLFPNAPEFESSVTRLDVKNAASVVAATKAAGATERVVLQIDNECYTLAVIFDHFGHLWSIREPDTASGRVAA